MIIFVKPHFHYDSMTDFWRLVSLSGFEWCYPESVYLNFHNVYIHTPVDNKTKRLSWWQKRRKNARMIIWDLERPKPRGGIEKHKQYLQQFNYDEIWHSDAQLAKDSNSRFVILGSDERLGSKPYFLKKYKFTHMAYENGRRETILQDIKGTIGPNAWGRKRDKILRQTRFGLNIHQDNDLYAEPLRFALFAAYRLPIISETLYDNFPLDDVMFQADYNDLAKLANEISKSSLLGQLTYEILCKQYQFGNVVKYATRN